MKFKNRRYITKGVDSSVHLLKRVVVRFNYQDKYAQLLSIKEYSKVGGVN